jgi:hypothetical protein
MTAANLPHLTQCGLPGIELVPFGMHACHFYDDREQLVAAMASYLVAGLCENERCLWITARPLSAREAIGALRAAWAGADDAIQSGALRILDCDRWYRDSAGALSGGLVDVWLAEEERALADGYNGLRITGNLSFLAPADWPAFMEYAQAVTKRLKGRRVVALCSYVLGECNDRQMSDVIQSHNCAFERREGAWQVVTSLKSCASA